MVGQVKESQSDMSNGEVLLGGSGIVVLLLRCRFCT